jgi:hypothetical protein
MLTINKNEGNVIFYSCDCGVIGRCIIKPIGGTNVILVDVVCPVCHSMERATILQYDTEEEKESLVYNLNEQEMSWSLIISNVFNKKG